jgi:hypothetical protein
VQVHGREPGVRGGERGGEPAGLGHVEAAQRQDVRSGVRGPLPHDGEQRVPGCDLRRAQRADQQDGTVPQGRDDEVEQEQRRMVGAVQVVEDQHQRLPVGALGEQREHAVEEPEAVGRLGRLRAALEQRPEVSEQAPASGADEALEHLRPGPERRRTLGLPTPPPDHPAAVPTGPEVGLLGQAGLADPGFAREEDQAAPATHGLRDAAVQDRQLRRTSDEDAATGCLG